jgi:hypothetical protein
MACNTFLRSGWSVVSSALLAKGGTSKKRLSMHHHKVPIWSNKVSPRTFQMVLVYIYMGQEERNGNVRYYNFSLIVVIRCQQKEWDYSFL